MDTKDWAGWRQLFTDDLIANTDSGPAKADGSHRHPEIADADRFVSFVIEALGDRPTVHHCHMPEIEILSDERARGIWAMEDVVQFPTGMLHGYGHYREEYRQDHDGEWRIARLHLTRACASISRRAPAPSGFLFRAGSSFINRGC